jgi:hypothetical protein
VLSLQRAIGNRALAAQVARARRLQRDAVDDLDLAVPPPPPAPPRLPRPGRQPGPTAAALDLAAPSTSRPYRPDPGPPNVAARRYYEAVLAAADESHFARLLQVVLLKENIEMLQSANQAEDVEHQRIALAQMPMRPAGAGSGARLLELYHRFRDQPLIHPFWRGVVEESRRRGVNPAADAMAVPSEPGPKADPEWLRLAGQLTIRIHPTAFAVWDGGQPDNQFTGLVYVPDGTAIGVLYLAPLVPGPQGSTNYPYAMLNDVDDDIEHRAPIMHTQPASRDAPYNRFRDEVAAGVSTATGVAKASVLMPAQASEPDIRRANDLAIAVVALLQPRILPASMQTGVTEKELDILASGFGTNNIAALRAAASRYPDQPEAARIANIVEHRFVAGTAAIRQAQALQKPIRGSSASHQLLADRFHVDQNRCVGFSVAQGPNATVKRFGWTSRSSNGAKFDASGGLPREWANKIMTALVSNNANIFGLGPWGPGSDAPPLISVRPPAGPRMGAPPKGALPVKQWRTPVPAASPSKQPPK